jgi:hypothetical protein
MATQWVFSHVKPSRLFWESVLCDLIPVHSFVSCIFFYPNTIETSGHSLYCFLDFFRCHIFPLDFQMKWFPCISSAADTINIKILKVKERTDKDWKVWGTHICTLSRWTIIVRSLTNTASDANDLLDYRHFGCYAIVFCQTAVLRTSYLTPFIVIYLEDNSVCGSRPIVSRWQIFLGHMYIFTTTQNTFKTTTNIGLTDVLKMWHSSNIWERRKQIKTWFRRKLRRDWTRVMLATIQSRTFCLLVCCLKT